jgi:SAM-dependent methyltransferase
MVEGGAPQLANSQEFGAPRETPFSRDTWRLILSVAKNPTLAYMFRKYLARQLVNDVPVGRFLEIGIGSGRFYEVLESLGFDGLCLDLNPRLIEEHQAGQSPSRERIRFLARDFFAVEENFDLIVAFEVLEHFQDDGACLRKWFEFLNPRGTLLFSVPAHLRQWTINDTRAGHARRYEKTELADKLKRAGFQVLIFWCYGFPILNWTYPFSQLLSKGDSLSVRHVAESGSLNIDAGTKLNSVESALQKPSSEPFMASYSRTADSGARRFQCLSRWVFHEMLWWPFLKLQKPFLNGDLGIGYLVKCQKKK